MCKAPAETKKLITSLPLVMQSGQIITTWPATRVMISMWVRCGN